MASRRSDSERLSGSKTASESSSRIIGNGASKDESLSYKIGVTSSPWRQSMNASEKNDVRFRTNARSIPSPVILAKQSAPVSVNKLSHGKLSLSRTWGSRRKKSPKRNEFSRRIIAVAKPIVTPKNVVSNGTSLLRLGVSLNLSTSRLPQGTKYFKSSHFNEPGDEKGELDEKSSEYDQYTLGRKLSQPETFDPNGPFHLRYLNRASSSSSSGMLPPGVVLLGGTSLPSDSVSGFTMPPPHEGVDKTQTKRASSTNLIAVGEKTQLASWVCVNCATKNNDDESNCRNCLEYRKTVIQDGWGDLFRNQNHGWKCESCAVFNDDTLKKCAACEEPRYKGNADTAGSMSNHEILSDSATKDSTGATFSFVSATPRQMATESTFKDDGVTKPLGKSSAVSSLLAPANNGSIVEGSNKIVFGFTAADPSSNASKSCAKPTAETSPRYSPTARKEGSDKPTNPENNGSGASPTNWMNSLTPVPGSSSQSSVPSTNAKTASGVSFQSRSSNGTETSSMPQANLAAIQTGNSTFSSYSQVHLEKAKEQVDSINENVSTDWASFGTSSVPQSLQPSPKDLREGENVNKFTHFQEPPKTVPKAKTGEVHNKKLEPAVSSGGKRSIGSLMVGGLKNKEYGTGRNPNQSIKPYVFGSSENNTKNTAKRISSSETGQPGQKSDIKSASSNFSISHTSDGTALFDASLPSTTNNSLGPAPPVGVSFFGSNAPASSEAIYRSSGIGSNTAAPAVSSSVFSAPNSRGGSSSVGAAPVYGSISTSFGQPLAVPTTGQPPGTFGPSTVHTPAPSGFGPPLASTASGPVSAPNGIFQFGQQNAAQNPSTFGTTPTLGQVPVGQPSANISTHAPAFGSNTSMPANSFGSSTTNSNDGGFQMGQTKVRRRIIKAKRPGR